MTTAFTKRELAILKKLNSPHKVQDYLDQITYRRENGCFSVKSALSEGRAHCFDGALIGASGLRRAGYEVFLIDLCATGDDDHVLCGFRSPFGVGAVAKSNFPGLRYREPIFRTVRELALSYFEFYFSLDGKKSLRTYAGPVALPDSSRVDWECSDDAAETLLGNLARAKHLPFLALRQARTLRPIDSRQYKSQMVGVDRKGAYGG